MEGRLRCGERATPPSPVASLHRPDAGVRPRDHDPRRDATNVFVQTLSVIIIIALFDCTLLINLDFQLIYYI